MITKGFNLCEKNMFTSIPSQADDNLLFFTAAERASGSSSQCEDLDLLPEFARREQADNEFTREEIRSFTPPERIKTLFLLEVKPQDILIKLLRQIRCSPNHETHLLVEIVINDLSEFEDGSHLLEETITEELFSELESIDENCKELPKRGDINASYGDKSIEFSALVDSFRIWLNRGC